MAAKLKKRALAEYQSQTIVQDDLHAPSPTGSSSSSTLDEHPSKKLKLVLSKCSSAVDAKSNVNHVLAIGKATSVQEISTAIISFVSRLKYLNNVELGESVKILCDFLRRPHESSLRVQAFLALNSVLQQEKDVTEAARAHVKDNLADLVDQMKEEKSHKVVSVMLDFLANLHDFSVTANTALYQSVFQIILEKLKTENQGVKVKSLMALTRFVIHSQDPSIVSQCISLAGKYTQSSDPRVRHSAFKALYNIHEFGHKLNVTMYSLFRQALEDDFDCVRLIGLKLIQVLAANFPEEQVMVMSKKIGSKPRSGETVRLVDDAFGRICNAINDLAVLVREEAAKLIGDMTLVSQKFLEQTLDKKLMSNMRLKKSAHEREAKMVSTGEWSSGKKWADDAPKEEIEADSINLMSFGACGAFIHGLEDEYLAVRAASIESLTKLSIQNPKLASLALDFLVDMFNDEIELVRLKAIESLKRIASHISLQVNQLETILSALDDFSIVVREKLHLMLQSSKIATNDGLQNVISKLLENLKKYPQDKRSILYTFKKLGAKHSELTLPLTTILLEIHPFFDVAEPDIDDPGYLCILVLVFNAAQHCPTMEPLLDQHTRRHYHFMLDTYPHLMPEREGHGLEKIRSLSHSERFFKDTLDRVLHSDHLSMANRIKLFERSSEDLKRLGSIEPTLADSAQYIHCHLQIYTLMLKINSTKFWKNPKSMSHQQLDIIQVHLNTLINSCLNIEHAFINQQPDQIFCTRVQKLVILSLQILFLVTASNKSALSATEQFFKEVDSIYSSFDTQVISKSPFLASLFKKLTETEDHKPGSLARYLQSLIPTHDFLSLVSINHTVAMSTAVIYEPQGMNETPLKYTAGMVLAVPVDCEIYNIKDIQSVRIAIKTPDQKVQLMTPKLDQFMPKEDKPFSYRLLTEALMSHQVWSEAVHVEISIVMDLSRLDNAKRNSSDKDKNLIQLCEPVKVYVLPKAVKRGI